MKAVRERSDIRAAALPDDLRACEPVVLRGLVADWPLVRAGRQSGLAADAYLRKFAAPDTPVVVVVADPDARGRVFYNDRFTGPNFEQHQASLATLLDQLQAHAAESRPPLLYMGSTTVEDCLPGLRAENDLAFGGRDALASIWIGNQARIAAHYDLPDNIACVAAGRRRFTLFPPDQLPNLYVGPLDVTPAGQAISLVDFDAPDFDRHPRFRAALAAAQTATLLPGDAILIPSMWWHQVESLGPFNILVNFWWRDTPAYMGPPINALFHALLAIRDLPPPQKAAWKQIFDHYVFENDPEHIAHIPVAGRGVLGPMTDAMARKLRAFLLNRLNR